MTGRTASQIEKASAATNSFKAFETRYEKFSHRSAESITTIKESFERKKELKDKWQSGLGRQANANENVSHRIQ